MAVKRKKKRKKKSKLQKRKDNPDSTYWRNKADKLWKEFVAMSWDHECAVCGSKDYVQAHHLIPREMRSHRHAIANGILLCASHHKYSFEMSPHKAPVAFIMWLINSRPHIWDWVSSQVASRHCASSYMETTAELERLTADAKPKSRNEAEDK